MEGYIRYVPMNLNSGMDENTIEREVVIAFRNSKCREIVRLDNKKSIKIEIIEGPIRGRKTITLKTIKNHTTRIDAEWDIRVSGFYGIFTGEDIGEG